MTKKQLDVTIEFIMEMDLDRELAVERNRIETKENELRSYIEKIGNSKLEKIYSEYGDLLVSHLNHTTDTFLKIGLELGEAKGRVLNVE
ncbi:MAG: hypothetical protein ACK5NU_10105 [Fusobacterium ulcerans]|uniref:hypothetical protein n=1 Tax=Fusobacterium ulcerans TaxID=861 RepID=UPI003A85EEA7